MLMANQPLLRNWPG